MALWGRIERVLKWRKSGRADEREREGRAPDWFEDDGGKQAPPMGVTERVREWEREAAGWPVALKCARDKMIMESPSCK